jgi:transposase-like protein
LSMQTNKSHWIQNMKIPAAQRKHICPGCQSLDITRATMQGFLERMLYRSLHISPYRCAACGRRFHDFMSMQATSN